MFASTVTGTVKVPAPEMLAVPLGLPTHAESKKIRMVPGACAVPETEGVVIEDDGETGAVAVKTGGAGGIESWVYENGAEHSEVFPVASAACA